MSRTGVGRCHFCGCEEKLTHYEDCFLFRNDPRAAAAVGIKFIRRDLCQVCLSPYHTTDVCPNRASFPGAPK